MVDLRGTAPRSRMCPRRFNVYRLTYKLRQSIRQHVLHYFLKCAFKVTAIQIERIVKKIISAGTSVRRSTKMNIPATVTNIKPKLPMIAMISLYPRLRLLSSFAISKFFHYFHTLIVSILCPISYLVNSTPAPFTGAGFSLNHTYLGTWTNVTQ